MLDNKRFDNKIRMLKKITREFAIAGLILSALFVCFGSIVSVFAEEPKTEQKANSTEGDFIRGAQAWANHCIRCHNIRDPKELRDDQWKVVVSHMRIRAGLTGQQTRDILKFLQESN